MTWAATDCETVTWNQLFKFNGTSRIRWIRINTLPSCLLRGNNVPNLCRNGITELTNTAGGALTVTLGRRATQLRLGRSGHRVDHKGQKDSKGTRPLKALECKPRLQNKHELTVRLPLFTLLQEMQTKQAQNYTTINLRIKALMGEVVWSGHATSSYLFSS